MLKSVTQCRHSSSRTTTITYNPYLRKRRKWPHPTHRSRWEQAINQHEAMRFLKRQTPKTAPTHFLPTLINSFNTFNCHPTPNAYLFLIKTLTLTLTHPSQLNPLLNHLQNVENFETPECIFVYLIRFYGYNNMIQHAIDLFFTIPNFRCNPTAYSLNSLLYVLCKNREGIQIVPQILLKSRLMGIRIEGSSFCILIKALCRIRKVGYAIKLFNYMIVDGFELEAVSVCSLILKTLCEERDGSGVEVMGLLEEMRRFGFCPDGGDWCNVIRFFVKRGKGMDALDALNKMKMDRIKPGVVSYTMVLDGLIGEGKYALVDELFDEMLVLGLVPDIYTYNVYISGLCRQNKVEEGVKMLGYMEELGCNPNLITYNILLEEFCKVGELEKAKKLVREMESKGMQQNARTGGIIIRGLVRVGEFDEACSWLWKMLGKCCIPHSSTVDEILCGLCHRGLVCNALEVLEEMVGKGVSPGIRAWEALILGCGYKSSLEETAFMDSISLIQSE